MDKIEDFLDRGEIDLETRDRCGGDIWQKIADTYCSYPVMDHMMNLIDEEDYYGVDFSGNRAVYMIFFSGSSNYFPGIWVPENDIENIEKYPIYIFDLQSGTEKEECIGNFRHFIEKVLNEFIENYKYNDEYKKCALKMLDELKENFSNELIHDEPYILNILS